MSRREDLAWVWGAVAMALVAVEGYPDVAFRDGDLPVHVRYGQEILANGGVPPVDPTVHPSAALVDHEWLSDAAFALLWDAGGLPAILLVTQLLFGLTMFGAVRLVARSGGGPAVQLVSGAVLLLTAWSHLATRPHLITWLFTVLLLGVAPVAARRGRVGAWLAGAFALGVAWINLHGGALIGPVVLVLLAAREAMDGLRDPAGRSAAKRLLLCATALGCGLFVNPWGPAMFVHIAEFLRSDVVANTHDFRPPAPFGTVAGVAMLGLTVWTGTLLAAARPRPSAWLWGLFWIAWGWSAARNVAMAGWVLAPLLGALGGATWQVLRDLGRSWVDRLDDLLARRRGPPAAWAVVGALTLALPAALRPADPEAPWVAREAIEALPAGAAVLPQDLLDAGWIALLRPDATVHLHSLTANYSEAGERMRTWLRVLNLHEDWLVELERSGSTALLLEPEHPLADALEQHGWTAHPLGARVLLTR